MDRFEDILSIKRSLEELVALEEDKAYSLNSIACSLNEVVEQLFIMNRNQNQTKDELSNALYVIMKMSRETLLMLHENRELEHVQRIKNEEKDL